MGKGGSFLQKGNLQAGNRVSLLCGSEVFSLSCVAAAREPKGYSHQRKWKFIPTEPSLKDQHQGPATIPSHGCTIRSSGEVEGGSRWKVGQHTPLTLAGEGPGPQPKPSGASPEALAQHGAASWQREAPAASARQWLHTRPVESRLRWWPQQRRVALGELRGDHFRHW